VLVFFSGLYVREHILTDENASGGVQSEFHARFSTGLCDIVFIAFVPPGPESGG